QNLAAALWSKGKTTDARMHSRPAAITHGRTTRKDYPFDVPTHNDLGGLLVQNRDVRAGIEQWETSLQIDPDDGNALNNLAWVLATYPADTIRDGKRAVELAEKAAVLPGGEAPIVLRTLAAAHAEAGDFSNAVNTAQHALDLATGQTTLHCWPHCGMKSNFIRPERLIVNRRRSKLKESPAVSRMKVRART